MEYVDAPDALTPFPIAAPEAPAAWREEMGEIPADAWYRDGSGQGNPPIGTGATIQPNTDTIWMEARRNLNSPWAELSGLAGDHLGILPVDPLH